MEHLGLTLTILKLPECHAHLAAHPFSGVGALRDDIDDPACGIGAVKGGHGASHDFNPFHIRYWKQIEVHDVVFAGPTQPVNQNQHRAACIAQQPPDGHGRVGPVRTRIDPCTQAQGLRDAGARIGLQLLPGDHLDRGLHIRNGLLNGTGRHHDFCQGGRGLLRPDGESEQGCGKRDPVVGRGPFLWVDGEEIHGMYRVNQWL